MLQQVSLTASDGGGGLVMGFIMRVNEHEVKFTPSIVTSLFVVKEFLDTNLCFLLCNVGKKTKFRKVSRGGETRFYDESQDAVLYSNDGREKIGAFDNATTMTVIFDSSAHRLADVKIFRSSIHICGLRNLNECLIILKYVVRYFEEVQRNLTRIYDEEASEGKLEFFSRYSENYPDLAQLITEVDKSKHACCTLPLVIVNQDIVMTNYKGEFNTQIDIRWLYNKLKEYPSVICHLSTMSNSNALNVIVLETDPFYPVKHVSKYTKDEVETINRLKSEYLVTSKRTKACQYIKHSVFIYSSGKFIQSSRKNDTSMDVIQMIVNIVMTEMYTAVAPPCLSANPPPPLMIAPVEEETEDNDEEDEEVEED